MKILKFISFLSILILFGCAATTNVISEYDTEANFNNYNTFVLCLDDFQISNTNYPKIDNAFVRDLIGQEVENKMLENGYKTNVFKPQLQAGFKISITQEESIITNCEIKSEFGYWKTCTINTEIYTKETLIVYVSDINKNQIIWQASIPCELNKSKRSLKKHVNTLVEQLFLEFQKAKESPNLEVAF